MTISPQNNDLINELSLFIALMEIDGEISTQEIVNISRLFHGSINETNQQAIQEELDELIGSQKDIDGICRSLSQDLNGTEKVFLVLRLLSLCYVDGIDEVEGEFIAKVASGLELDLEIYAGVLKAFEGELKALENKSDFLTFSGESAEGEIQLVGFPGKFVIVRQDNQYLGIVLECENLFLSDLATNNFDVFLLNPEDKLRLRGSTFVFTLSDLQQLFENKQRDKGELQYIINEGEQLVAKSEKTGQVMAQLQREKNHYLISDKDDAYLMRVSGKPIPSDVVHRIFEREVLSFEVEGKILVYEEDGVSGQQAKEESHYQLKNWDESFPKSASLILQRDESGAQAITYGIEDTIYKNGLAVPYNFHVDNGDILRVKNLLLEVEIKGDKLSVDHKLVPIREVKVDRLFAKFPGTETYALDNMSFTIRSGELAAIMGPAGSGKSTLLNTLLGQLKPCDGQILINGQATKRAFLDVKEELGFVPQDDLLIGDLTVAENLYYKFKFTRPELSEQEIDSEIDVILDQVGLLDKKSSPVGTVEKRALSGGERRRCNIAMELVSNPSLMVLDEPTSGLSSYDAEIIMSLLRRLAHQGKIIAVVIHQPSSIIYKMFDTAIILNKKGKKAFSGSNIEALTLFGDAIKGIPQHRRFVECPKCETLNPDILMKALGSENAGFWDTVKLFTESIKSEATIIEAGSEGFSTRSEKPSLARRLQEARYQFQRILLVKIRDRINLFVTLVVAPALSVLSALCLRYYDTESEAGYSLADNQQYPTFLFILVLSAIFLGLSNSIIEVIKDRYILKRESLIDSSICSYYICKFVALLLFALAQSVLFIVPAHLILKEYDMILAHIPLMTLVSASGIATGLLCSCLTRSHVAAYNMIPLILVPQILLGGALLKFEDMNPAMGNAHRSADDYMPVIAQLMISRWGSEMLVTANHDLHPDITTYVDSKEKEKTERAQAQKQYREKTISRKERNEKRKAIRAKYAEIQANLDGRFNKEIEDLASRTEGHFGSPVNDYAKGLWQGTWLEPCLSRTWKRNVVVLLLFTVAFMALGIITLKSQQVRNKL